MNEQKLLIEGLLQADMAKFMRVGQGTGGIALKVVDQYLEIKKHILETVEYFKNTIFTIKSEDRNNSTYGGVFINKAENNTPKRIDIIIRFHKNEIEIAEHKYDQIKIIEIIKV